MSFPMIGAHAAMAYLGMRGRSVGRRKGVPLALYEVLYYTAALLALRPPPALAIPLYVFAALHFAGGAAYVAGRPRISEGLLGRPDLLTYYAAYELAELAFLLAILAYLLAP